MKSTGLLVIDHQQNLSRFVFHRNAALVQKVTDTRDFFHRCDIAIGRRMENHRVPVEGRLQIAIVLVLHFAERFEQATNVPPLEVMGNGVLEKVLERVLCF